MKMIDGHVHLGDGIKMQLDEDTLLKHMDFAGIDIAIACSMDKYLAVYNREGNEFIAKAVRRHPDRLMGMASVNPWYGKKACDELNRALCDGLCGLKLHPVLQGFRLSDPIVYPLLEIADKADVPVYVHTGTAGIAEPFHALGLALDFPRINFIMGHAGASDYYNDTVRALEFAQNLYIESSRNGPANFCHWQINNAVDRVIFGSNAPEYHQDIEILNIFDVFTDMSDREKIFENNIRKVYKGRIPL